MEKSKADNQTRVSVHPSIHSFADERSNRQMQCLRVERRKGVWGEIEREERDGELLWKGKPGNVKGAWREEKKRRKRKKKSRESREETGDRGMGDGRDTGSPSSLLPALSCSLLIVPFWLFNIPFHPVPSNSILLNYTCVDVFVERISFFFSPSFFRLPLPSSFLSPTWKKFQQQKRQVREKG